MRIQVHQKIPNTASGVFFIVSEDKYKKEVKTFDDAMASKQILDLIKAEIFTGKKESHIALTGLNKKGTAFFAVGRGKKEEKNLLRDATGRIATLARKYKLKSIAIVLPTGDDPAIAISGALLGHYTFKIGDTSEDFLVEKCTVVTDKKLEKKLIDTEIALAQSTNFTRDLINTPPSLMNPEVLAQEAKKIAKISRKVKVKILGEKEMEKLKMGSLLAVGRGSDIESKLIVLEYKGGKKDEEVQALVGKGVCFDSGGYNIKPTGHIEDMKVDMSGAATVLGAFRFIAETLPEKNVVGVIGAVENMVSGNAYKPGDIVTAMNGKTIEVTNTDAEGRLVLADALYYTATKLKPDVILDFATLTGACMAALGMEISAIMGNDKKVINRIKKASELAGEEVWELPLTEHFREKVKGTISDLQNWTTGVHAGASMGGGLFGVFCRRNSVGTFRYCRDGLSGEIRKGSRTQRSYRGHDTYDSGVVKIVCVG
jgi:leucyl aminopeptidase